ncbi:hypothetical protein FIU85_21785 (plasmid) [Roseovarius sp. THAF8]|nr:hypothetical protein FIU85_21785 [Roseovarius sp. THAF8]
MPEFCSFFVFPPEEIELVQAICRKANWSASAITDPSHRYKFTETGMSEVSRANALQDFEYLRDGEEYGQLLVLETEEQEQAKNIVQLISAACIVLEGCLDQKGLPTHAFPLSSDPSTRGEVFESVFQKDPYFKQFTHRDPLPIAVAMAAAAWDDRALVYAIHKLAMSYEIEHVTPWSMHPWKGQVFEKHTEDFASHVGTSVAINLAYSSIEELRLTVQASSEKPRSLKGSGKYRFAWNPEVLEPFKERLEQAGISRSATVDWVTRGDKTEVPIYEIIDTLCEYSDGLEIRDREVPVPDAINFCEYLRNTMTAHAFSSSTSRLGPYEVYNTQHVARFLILSKCNLWRVRADDLRKRYQQDD